MELHSLNSETLAAFLDNRLTPEERARVLERIERDPDTYEAFVEAAGVLRDLERENQLAVAAPVRRVPWRSPVVQLMAAAVVAAVVLVPWAIMRARAPGVLRLLSTQALIDGSGDGRIAATLGASWDQPGWSVTRGGGALLDPSQRDFRIGARVADLNLAAQTGDTDAMARVVPEIESMLGSVAASAPLVAQYRDLTRPGAASSEGIRELAAQTRSFLGNSPFFDLGIWGEQARLAVLVDRTDAFSQERVRALSGIEQRLGPEEPVIESVRSLQRLLDGWNDNAQLDALRLELENLYRLAGG